MSLPSYPKYRDSGVEWLGKVPAHWKFTKTKYVCTFTTGWTPPTGDSSAYDGENLWANISDLGEKLISDTTKRISNEAVRKAGIALSPKGSLLFSFKLSIGQVSFVAREMYTNEAIATFRDSNELSVAYAYYAFPLFLIQNAAKNIYGAKLLNQELIRSAFLTLPPHPEQTTIAAFLDRETDKIDALIAEQERLLALLAEKRQATISHAVTRGRRPDAAMKDSGVSWLGKVPAHWTIKRIKQLVRESIAGPYGSSLTKSMYVDSGYRVYGQQQVIPDNFTVGDYYISEEKFAEMSRYQVMPGDILISVMGTIGKAALVPEGVEPGIINPRLVLYRPFEELISPRYLQVFVNSLTSQKYFSLAAQGTTMEGLNMVSIGELQVAVPPQNEQKEILEFINRENEKIGTLFAEVTRTIGLLKERRSALIAGAVTGKVDVRGQPSALKAAV